MQPNKSQITLSEWYESTYASQVSTFIFNTSQRRERQESTGNLVIVKIQNLQIRQLAQFSRDGTWGIQNSVRTYKRTSHPIQLKGKGLWKASLFFYIEHMSREKEREIGVPVSLLSDKFRNLTFSNLPNAAGMGPEVYKARSKHTKNKSHYPTGYERAKRKQAYSFILNASQGKEGRSTGNLVVV
jgi:hypothetical protein